MFTFSWSIVLNLNLFRSCVSAPSELTHDQPMTDTCALPKRKAPCRFGPVYRPAALSVCLPLFCPSVCPSQRRLELVCRLLSSDFPLVLLALSTAVLRVGV